MARTTLIQRKKRQKMLVAALVGLVLVTVLMLWFGLFSQPSAPLPLVSPEQPSPSEERIRVDFSIFDHPIFQILQVPLPDANLPDNIGRENPFVPLGRQ